MSGLNEISIGSLAKGIRGVTYKPNQLKQDIGEEDFFLLRSNNIQNGSVVFSDRQIVDKVCVSEKQKLIKGDVIVCMSNGSRPLVGKSALINLLDGNYCVGSFCSSFRVNKGINPNFVFQVFRSPKFKNSIDIILSGSAINNLQNKHIEELSFMIPSSPIEQTQIALILSKADQGIEQTEKLIAKYQRIKTGLMQDLLTKGIDEKGNIRSEKTHRFKTENGLRVPAEWEVNELSAVGNIVTGSTPPVKDLHNYGEDYLFVTPADVTPNQFIVSSDRKLSKQGFSLCRKLPKNSICIVCIGSTIGKISMTNELCTTNQQINSIIPFQVELAEFYFYSLQIFLDLQLRREAGLQAVPIVNKSSFSKMIIPVPKEKDETLKILVHLNKIQSVFEKYQNNLHKLQSLKTGLMQDLLTGKVRVKIKEEILVNR